ncbi:hypothetical protein OIU77_019440 [Salix suchowensis]|uniref:Uncharacterized protein n=1 Tax=Salix suchowensis TaxID=1278906 RepID=A0ABQ9CG07_9ROSI|nr:hypothetical protein OIU77_019440 [Salix suchowensis]
MICKKREDSRQRSTCFYCVFEKKRVYYWCAEWNKQPTDHEIDSSIREERMELSELSLGVLCSLLF